MNFLKHIKRNHTLDLSLQPDIDIEELVDFLWYHNGITGLRLGYCLVNFAETHDRSSYYKLLLLAKSFRAGHLSHLEHLDLSDNQLGKIIFNPPQDSEDYNILLQWSYVPVVNTISSFINAFKYYYHPEKNPACKLNPPCSLLEYFGQSLATAKMTYLMSLSLNHTEITDYDLDGVCNSLIRAAMPHLRTLSLSTNLITCFGMESIAHVVRCKKLINLHKLDLSGNYISNVGVIKLFQALEYVKDTKMQIINLEYNSISGGIMDSTMSIIKKLPNITNIELKGNELSSHLLNDIQTLLTKTINKRTKNITEVKRNSRIQDNTADDDSDNEMYLSMGSLDSIEESMDSNATAINRGQLTKSHLTTKGSFDSMEASMDSNTTVINRSQFTRPHVTTRCLDDGDDALVIHLVPVENDVSTLGEDSIA